MSSGLPMPLQSPPQVGKSYSPVMNCYEGQFVSALQETITTTIINIMNHRQKVPKWSMGKVGERSHQSCIPEAAP